MLKNQTAVEKNIKRILNTNKNNSFYLNSFKMENNCSDRSTVIFVNEPKQNFHYRYKSEMGMSHGVINGQVDGTFPKVKVNIDPNKSAGDLYVLCTLHCYSNNGKVLSPHLLLRKTDTEPNYLPIFQLMETDDNYLGERWWELKDYVIIRLAEAEYRTSFEKKLFHYNQLGLPLEFKEILGEINMSDSKSLKNSGQLNVCLGVTIFNNIGGHYSLYDNTIFSCNIFNGDDLRIHQICNTKGSVDGGTRVTLLIKLKSNFPIQIGIKKIHDTAKLTEWFTKVDVNPRDIFGNHAITFSMPAYGGPPYNRNEIDVDVFVIVNQSTYKSNSVKFHYLNYTENYLPRKRLRNMDNDGQISRDSGLEEYISRDKISVDDVIVPELNSLHLSDEKMNIKGYINRVYEIIISGQEINMDDHTIFADLLSFDNCIHLYKLCKNSQFRNFIVNWRNSYGENLLHIACKTNKFQLMAPFIGMGCCVNEQDIFGRTPLHIAIDKKNNGCMLEIQRILQNISNYPPNVKKSLIEMLRTYNENGYTVMHTTALGGHYELLENLLKFCVQHQINFCDYGTLECGDSIGHLILKHKLMELLPLLQQYVPDFEKIQNYEGQIVKDLMSDQPKFSAFIK